MAKKLADCVSVVLRALTFTICMYVLMTICVSCACVCETVYFVHFWQASSVLYIAADRQFYTCVTVVYSGMIFYITVC